MKLIGYTFVKRLIYSHTNYIKYIYFYFLGVIDTVIYQSQLKVNLCL